MLHLKVNIYVIRGGYKGGGGGQAFCFLSFFELYVLSQKFRCKFVPFYRRVVPICEWFVPICEWFVLICEWFVIILMGYHLFLGYLFYLLVHM